MMTFTDVKDLVKYGFITDVSIAVKIMAGDANYSTFDQVKGFITDATAYQTIKEALADYTPTEAEVESAATDDATIANAAFDVYATVDGTTDIYSYDGDATDLASAALTKLGITAKALYTIDGAKITIGKKTVGDIADFANAGTLFASTELIEQYKAAAAEGE